MTSAVYAKGLEAFGNAQINWVDDDIAAHLIDLALYSPDMVADQFLSDIPVDARIGAMVGLTGKTNLGGVLDADDVSFAGLSSAPTLEALAIFKNNSGDEATSALICLIDDASGLPVAAGKTQVDVAWSNGSNKIMKL